MRRGVEITVPYMACRALRGYAATGPRPRLLHNITFPDVLKDGLSRLRRGLLGLLLAGAGAAAHAVPLDVMHWWTSAGERRARPAARRASA